MPLVQASSHNGGWAWPVPSTNLQGLKRSSSGVDGPSWLCSAGAGPGGGVPAEATRRSPLCCQSVKPLHTCSELPSHKPAIWHECFEQTGIEAPWHVTFTRAACLLHRLLALLPVVHCQQ